MHLSIMGGFVSEKTLFSIRHKPTQMLPLLRSGIPSGKRKVTRLESDGRDVLVDVTTGSVYDRISGYCLSSRHLQLDISEIK